MVLHPARVTERKTMNKRHQTQSKVGRGLIAVAVLLLALPPSQVLGGHGGRPPHIPPPPPENGGGGETSGNPEFCPQSNATLDTDGDGLTDNEECNTFSFPGSGGGSIPPCTGASGEDRETCFDPGTPDLALYLRLPSSGSVLPADPFEFIKLAIPDGIDVTLHLINENQTDNRKITTGHTALGFAEQRAVQITELLDPTGSILGTSTVGVNGTDKATLFTKRIEKIVVNAYTDAGLSPSGTQFDTDLKNYLLRNAAHELGHILGLKKKCSNKDGCHDPGGSGVIMEKSVAYTVETGVVTFLTGTVFADSDHTDACYTNVNSKRQCQAH